MTRRISVFVATAGTILLFASARKGSIGTDYHQATDRPQRRFT